MTIDSAQKKVAVMTPDGKRDYVSMTEFMDKLRYANLSQIKVRDLENNKDYNPTYRKYTKSQIVTYLGNPANYETQLRQMSQYLYNISNYYRRLIQYFASMSTFSYIVVPYGIDRTKSVNLNKFKKGYYAVINQLEKMNIRHEFTRALTVAFRDDVYYGYAWETNDSYTFQQLDPDYCKISSIEDGVYNFAFNFSYFDANSERLPNFPPEFTTMYNAYAKDSNLKWQELSSDNTVCIKINEQTHIPIPPFVSLFSALADIEDYRAISKNASEVNNYKALALEIPTGDDGTFLIDYDLCKDFYDMLCNVLPENIGAFMSPMKVSSWNFEKSGAVSGSDDVEKAEASMWTQAGVNSILFGGGDKDSATSVKWSTINDQMIVFTVMRQIERWINRKLKSVSTAIKFKVNILDVTYFNRQEMHDQYVKDGQYGLPVRSAIMATAGYSPSDMENMLYLENEVLGLKELEVPLTSSNTQSADSDAATDDGGRPTNASKGKDLSDAGAVTQENDSNANSEG